MSSLEEKTENCYFILTGKIRTVINEHLDLINIRNKIALDHSLALLQVHTTPTVSKGMQEYLNSPADPLENAPDLKQRNSMRLCHGGEA